MIELTTEQGQAIGEAPDPVLVVDPATKREFVLIRADVFSRLQASLGDVDPSEAYTAVDRAFAAGWNDQKMDDYDEYEQNKK
jgi:hypothetical protein